MTWKEKKKNYVDINIKKTWWAVRNHFLFSNTSSVNAKSIHLKEILILTNLLSIKWRYLRWPDCDQFPVQLTEPVDVHKKKLADNLINSGRTQSN